MIIFILLGLINGFCIALSRILNGQLSTTHGAFNTSFINHLVGFAFLSVLMLCLLTPINSLPMQPSLYIGGMIGSLYVAVNSFVMTRLGSTNAIILVISGQMLFSLIIELFHSGSEHLIDQLTGIAFIILGIILKEFITSRTQKSTSLTKKC